LANEQQSFVQKLLIWVEDLWVRSSVYVCVVLGLTSGALHFFGYLVNVRSSTANIITFASIVIGVTGVFLTLIITLQESPVFTRLRNYFPAVQSQLYSNLRTLINHGLVVVILSIGINSMPPSPFKWLASVGVAIWFYFFWSMSLGAFYAVKLITDLVVKNFNIPTRTTRQ